MRCEFTYKGDAVEVRAPSGRVAGTLTGPAAHELAEHISQLEFDEDTAATLVSSLDLAFATGDDEQMKKLIRDLMKLTGVST